MKDEYPDGWSRTIEDLLKDGGQCSGLEIEWARAFERDQLKKSGARFPSDGDIYEALGDVEITLMSYWRAPFSSGEKALLPAGTRIRAEVDPSQPEPVSAYAVPLEYERLEIMLVPQPDRDHDKYAGYSVSVKTAQLNSHFRLVSKLT